MTPADRAPEADGAAPPATLPATVKVWDILTRIFHWSLVSIMAYEFLFRAGTTAHIVLGYVALGLIAFRIIWGFVGPRHARFSDFVKSPATTLRYLWQVVSGHPKRYLGHNPAGATMVLALLAMVTATAVTGYAMTTDALWGEEWIETLHNFCADATLALAAAHVLGVIVASLQHRENLVRAMVTGRKPVETPES
jgi:cytochrome b